MGGFNLTEIQLYSMYLYVCVDLGKAGVRWAALMCRNAKIPQWLCRSAVSLRQPLPPPNPNRTMGMNRTGGTLKALALSSCSHTHTHTSLVALYRGLPAYYKDFSLSVTSLSFILCTPALSVLHLSIKSSTLTAGLLNKVKFCLCLLICGHLSASLLICLCVYGVGTSVLKQSCKMSTTIKRLC